MKFFRMIALGIILFIFMPQVTWSVEEDPFLHSFVSSGAKLETYDVVDWSVINREFMGFSDMEQKSDTIIKFFGGNKQNFKSSKESDEMYRIINMEGELDSDTFLQIIIQSVNLPKEYERRPQTYLVLTVTGRNVEDLKQVEAKVRRAVVSSGGQSRITTCITGSFDGKLNEAAQDKILKRFAEDLKIDKLEWSRDEYAASAVGYSPLLSDSIEILGKKYNVNIALRYNSEDDRTYIWIGTPVISVEY